MTTSDLLALIALIISAGTFTFTWYNESRSHSLAAFLSFTQRYDEVYSGIKKDLDTAQVGAPREDTRLKIVRYLNLCSEEYFYHEEHYIPDRLWRIWSTDIENKIRTPLLSTSWKYVRGEYDSYQSFQQWVDKVSNFN